MQKYPRAFWGTMWVWIVIIILLSIHKIIEIFHEIKSSAWEPDPIESKWLVAIMAAAIASYWSVLWNWIKFRDSESVSYQIFWITRISILLQFPLFLMLTLGFPIILAGYLDPTIWR